jgi:hypothetical protein
MKNISYPTAPPTWPEITGMGDEILRPLGKEIKGKAAPRRLHNQTKKGEFY